MEHPSKIADEDVAVIGFAVKLPGDASSTSGYWRMLLEGRSAVTRIPKSRMNAEAFQGTQAGRFDQVSLPLIPVIDMFRMQGVDQREQ